ncbi:MAG: archaellin/type IV pilin N-terminal domain-containing protein [Desulfurococcaceae archaeon]
MKGVSGIVATAILLALTIAGGVFLYNYVSHYLNTSTKTGNIVIENAILIRSLRRLDVTVRNIGLGDARVIGVEIVGAVNKEYEADVVIPTGKTTTIYINIDEQSILNISGELYVRVKYDKTVTEPISVRIL